MASSKRQRRKTKRDTTPSRPEASRRKDAPEKAARTPAAKPTQKPTQKPSRNPTKKPARKTAKTVVSPQAAKPAARPATKATTKSTAREAARRAVRSRRAARHADAIIDAVVQPDALEPQPTFESLTQANRSFVLLDEGFSTARGEERIDAVALARLRAHILLMRHGRFAAGGDFASMPEDAESLVREHLRAWIASLRGQEIARVVLCAHDIFASEDDILRLARHQAGWWLANGVYPIHVIWESGFEETLIQLLDAARDRALGGEVRIDGGVDPVLEGAVRVLGGPTLWGGARRGAERAFDADGAGRALLTLLREEIEQSKRPVEIHLVGYGAGSGFQSQVVRSMAAMRVSPARTLALLAPTLSVPEFRAAVAPFTGFAVRRIALFTLARDLERTDRCGPYRKSILSLLRGALEEEPGTEILGLEESLRRSPDVARLFGLAGVTGAPGEALFAGIAPGITDATTRGGFEDDVATMNSVLRRVLDQPLGGIIAYQSLGGRMGHGFDRRLESELERRGIDWAWMRARLLEPATSAPTEAAQGSSHNVSFMSPAEEVVVPVSVATDAELPVEESIDAAVAAAEVMTETSEAPSTIVDVVLPAPPVSSGEIAHVLRAASPNGRRHALCIGIDRYVGRPLNGATADALLWNETFARLGFITREPLLDAQATRAEILGNVRSLLGEARDGDTVAVHFSGYGATVRDAWEEESGSASAMSFEALVPVDVDAGAFVLGGDLAELLRDASEGVHVAFFLDCSFTDGTSRIHSSHLGGDVAVPTGEGDHDTDIEPLRRTYPVSEAIGAKHVALRRRIGQLLRPGAGWDSVREGASALFFLASAADGSAWERDGYGAFSLAATRVLRTSRAAGRVASLTNASFLDAVRDVIDGGAQRPELHCLGAVRHSELFASAVEQVSVTR